MPGLARRQHNTSPFANSKPGFLVFFGLHLRLGPSRTQLAKDQGRIDPESIHAALSTRQMHDAAPQSRLPPDLSIFLQRLDHYTRPRAGLSFIAVESRDGQKTAHASSAQQGPDSGVSDLCTPEGFRVLGSLSTSTLALVKGSLFLDARFFFQLSQPCGDG
mgnify:CR=1 FL=1